MSTRWTPEVAFELLDRVGHAYALVQARSASLVADLEIHPSELVALFVLLSCDAALSQTEWGRLQGVSRQRAHAITKRLVAEGLVHHARPGRASIITLTEQGRALAEAQREAVGAGAFAALGALGEADALALHAGLGRLITALEAGGG